jgi:hypothetical protein
MKTARAFLTSTSGNAAVIFSLAAVPLLLGAGAAVDMVRANRTEVVLQNAADAAALAGATSKKSEAELEQIAMDFLVANGGTAALDIVDDIEFKKQSGSFKVHIKGKIKTGFMSLAGIPAIDLDAMAEVASGTSALEVALVLDNTDSMNAEGRLDDLKDSAKELVDSIFDNAPEGGYTRVGLVPFANYVNVGLVARNRSYMSVAADSSTTNNQCWSEYPNATSSNCRTVPYTYDVLNVPNL